MPRLAIVGTLLVTGLPLIGALAWGPDDESTLRVFLVALGSVAAIVVAVAVFLVWEIGRHRRLHRSVADAPDQSVSSRTV